MRTIFLFFLSLTVLPILEAQELDKRLIGIEQEIDSLMEAYNAVGLAVIVVEREQVIYANGFGYRDLGNKKPVTLNTRFGLGSLTKQFTSSLIGIYQGKGKLSIDDRPAVHLDDIRFYNEEMNRLLTIEDLLLHRSGLGNMDGPMVFFPSKDLTENIRRLPHLVPGTSFRGGYAYSNMGYSILGSITEAITARSWSENIKLDLLQPLGMHDSNTSIAELESSDDFSYGYSVHEDKAVKVLFDQLYESSPGGSINSSVSDMSHWIRTLLAGGRYNDVQVIPREYLERAFSGHITMRHRFSFDEKDPLLFDMYGYGWAVHDYHDIYKVSHGGAVSGFTSTIDLFPYKGLGIAVLVNQHLSSIGYQVSDMMARRMLSLEVREWRDYNVEHADARMYDEEMAPINQKNKPSLDLREYCGRYVHAGYGILEISLEDGQLFSTFPAFKLGFEHVGGDVFYNKSILPIHQNCPGFEFTFSVEEGKVHSVSAFLQSGGVVFEKVE